MNRLSRRFVVGLWALVLLVSLTGAMAGGHAGETVHAETWKGFQIFIDGAPICFTNEAGRRARPMLHQGTVYIPLHTAGEWLGATVEWDEAAAAVTLTTGGEPYYRDAYLEQPRPLPGEAGEAEQAQLQRDYALGVDLTLRPDITLTMDGVERRFFTAGGDPLSMATHGQTLYLPVRGAAQLCGKEILWTPPRKPVGYLASFAPLHLPPEAPGRSEVIELFDAPTQAQVDEAQAYLDRMRGLFSQCLRACEEFQSSRDLTREEILAQFKLIQALAEEARAAAPPSFPYFNGEYESIRAKAWGISAYRMGQCIQAVEQGRETFASYQQDGHFEGMLAYDLQLFRGAINGAQEALDRVALLVEGP